MRVFDVLTLFGGLCLFLFGMSVMGDSLERRTGSKLRGVLSKLTSNKLIGLLTGLAVTSVIQSSSATTVMVVGFVNSGLLTLSQAINVIMGANIGTTITAWILSLSGIDANAWYMRLLKPDSFTPVLAVIGIILYMFCKSNKKKDTGTILLGFATLMFGMDIMSGAVSGLADVPQFRQLFLLFENPILGVLAGAVLTAIIQSSSASVGILQTLAGTTGQVTLAAAIPIIMGQNIGTCITAMLSSVGTNKNAKRAALVHLSFNIIGTAIGLALFSLIQWLVKPVLFTRSADEFSIALAHSVFNVLSTLVLFPLSGLLEKLVNLLVPDAKTQESDVELDERLLNTPPIALERCHNVAKEMAALSADALKGALAALITYSPEAAQAVRDSEDRTDRYEDALSTYLVRLSRHQMSDADSAESAKLLKVIGDFERISDHAVNLLESAEEIKEKEILLSPSAKAELTTLTDAVNEVLDLALAAFVQNDLSAAARVEALEQVIDNLKEQIRTRHILRLQQGLCSIEVGFVLSDILTDLERTSDHCSNIAGCLIDAAHTDMELHRSLRALRADDKDYKENYKIYAQKYNLAVNAPL